MSTLLHSKLQSRYPTFPTIHTKYPKKRSPKVSKSLENVSLLVALLLDLVLDLFLVRNLGESHTGAVVAVLFEGSSESDILVNEMDIMSDSVENGSVSEV